MYTPTPGLAPEPPPPPPTHTQAFEEALSLQPKDSELISKIARALVTTHDYQRAMDFYNKSIHNSRSNFSLQLELATLLMRLRQWAQSMAMLQRVLDRPKENPGGVDNLALDVESFLLMARIYKGSMDMDNYLASEERALELQKVGRGRGGGSEGTGGAGTRAEEGGGEAWAEVRLGRARARAILCALLLLLLLLSHVD